MDVEKLRELFESLVKEVPTSHVRIEKPNGEILEKDVEMFSFCGLNSKTGESISWSCVEVIGGMDKVMDVVYLLGMLSHICEDLRKSLVDSVPGMTNDHLFKMVSDVMEHLDEKEKEVTENDENHD